MTNAAMPSTADLTDEGYDEDQIADLIDDPEEYQGYGVFVVPPAARWTIFAENTKGKPASRSEAERTIGSLVDDSMSALMGANENLHWHPAPPIQQRQHRSAPTRRTHRPVQQRPV